MFGDGTARFTAATAAAAKRATAAKGVKSASRPVSSEILWGADGGVAKGREDDKDESGRLAGFLSNVLKGLVDAEEGGDEVRDRREECTAYMGAAIGKGIFVRGLRG